MEPKIEAVGEGERVLITCICRHSQLIELGRKLKEVHCECGEIVRAWRHGYDELCCELAMQFHFAEPLELPPLD
jgi:hypothetical protein